MQRHAPISGCPVTQPIASNRETMVHVKPTNSSPLLRNQSHVDNRYKKGLLRTTLDGAHRLSSS